MASVLLPREDTLDLGAQASAALRCWRPIPQAAADAFDDEPEAVVGVEPEPIQRPGTQGMAAVIHQETADLVRDRFIIGLDIEDNRLARMGLTGLPLEGDVPETLGVFGAASGLAQNQGAGGGQLLVRGEKGGLARFPRGLDPEVGACLNSGSGSWSMEKCPLLSCRSVCEPPGSPSTSTCPTSRNPTLQGSLWPGRHLVVEGAPVRAKHFGPPRGVSSRRETMSTVLISVKEARMVFSFVSPQAVGPPLAVGGGWQLPSTH